MRSPRQTGGETQLGAAGVRVVVDLHCMHACSLALDRASTRAGGSLMPAGRAEHGQRAGRPGRIKSGGVSEGDFPLERQVLAGLSLISCITLTVLDMFAVHGRISSQQTCSTNHTAVAPAVALFSTHGAIADHSWRGKTETVLDCSRKFVRLDNSYFNDMMRNVYK